MPRNIGKKEGIANSKGAGQPNGDRTSAAPSDGRTGSDPVTKKAANKAAKNATSSAAAKSAGTGSDRAARLNPSSHGPACDAMSTRPADAVVHRPGGQILNRAKVSGSFKAFHGRKGTEVVSGGTGSPPQDQGNRPAPRTLREGIEFSLESRARGILRDSLGRMTPEQLERAIAAPTAAGTVVEVLNASPDVGLPKETAMTRALARGAVAKQEMILEARGCFSSGEVAALLGITPAAVNLRRTRNTILAVPLSGGEWGFPARQFASDDVRKGLAEVTREGAGISPWVLLSILLEAVPGSADGVILDHLHQAEVRGDVLARIRSYGEHVAS